MLVEPLGDGWDEARIVRAASAMSGRPGFVWLDANAPPEGRWSWLGVEPVERVVVGPGEDVLAAVGRLGGGLGGEGLGREGLGRDGLGREGLGREGLGREDEDAHAHMHVDGDVDVDVHEDMHVDVDGGGGGGGDDGGQGQGQGQGQGDVLLFDPPRWIGLLAYDALWAGALDGRSPRVGSRHAHERAVMRFGRYDALIGVDHVQGRAWVVADDEAAARRLRVALDAPCPAPSARVEALEVTDAEAHVRAIEEARAAIARGELYQVNLARRWRGRFEGAPLALALAMREASPVPFGFFLHEGERAWIARSMERFLAWSPDARGRGVLETRPIKGTVPRDPDDRDDAVDRLRADPKELAEHAMIVDLLRNDLARVAETGSVEVVAPMVVEAYAKLHHLVSTVRCTTREGTRLRDVLAATFPPGSVTGAPKAAAVALIDALEPFARGSYCGAHGYVSRRGALSLSVSIRTAEIEDDEVSYFAGGGIVWPSDARREVAETELKARVFLDAVEALARSAG